MTCGTFMLVLTRVFDDGSEVEYIELLSKQWLLPLIGNNATFTLIRQYVRSGWRTGTINRIEWRRGGCGACLLWASIPGRDSEDAVVPMQAT